MTTAKQNICAPGVGFLFTQDGLSLRDMAVKLHEDGYLTDEEMAEDGGVPALRRKLYDTIHQNRHHYSTHRKLTADLTKEERKKRMREEKLERDMNTYADALGVNDPKYMDMIIEPEYLEAFGIKVTGKNLVEAELVAKAMRNNPQAIEKISSAPSQTMLRILDMVKWVLAEKCS